MYLATGEDNSSTLIAERRTSMEDMMLNKDAEKSIRYGGHESLNFY